MGRHCCHRSALRMFSTTDTTGDVGAWCLPRFCNRKVSVSGNPSLCKASSTTDHDLDSFKNACPGLVSFWVLDLWNLHLMEPVVADLGSHIHIISYSYSYSCWAQIRSCDRKGKTWLKRQDLKNEKEEQTSVNATTTEWQCPSQRSGLLPRRKGRCAEQCSLLHGPSLLMVDVFWEGCKRHSKMAAGNIHSRIISIFWNHASLFPCLKLSNLVTTWFTCQEFGRGFRSWNFVASSFFLWFSETPRPIWMTKLKCSCWLRWLKIQYLRTCFSALEENLNRQKGHLQFFNAADLRLVRHRFAHVSIASSKSTWSAQVML